MTEPTRPVGVDALADYVEGLLDPDERAQVELAIAEDPQTAALVAELEALPDLLAATDVEPMPADVVARVDAAIARESQDRAAAPVPTGRRTTRARRWLVPAMAAAATVGVIAVAGPVVLEQGGQDGGAESTRDAPAAAGQESAEDRGGEFSGPDEEATGGYVLPGRTADGTPQLTSARFAAQVERLYAGATLATRGDLAAAPETTDGQVTLPGEFLAGRWAPVCYGDVESTFRTAVVLDGKPAYLLVYENPGRDGAQQAIAFRCDGDVPRILEQEPIDLP